MIPSRRTAGQDPSDGSTDPSAHFDWWPVQGSASEWLEMTFAAPPAVSQSQIYWFDDTGRGGVRVPGAWRLLYKAGDSCLPVQTQDQFGVALNGWHTVRFSPVTTSALRLKISTQSGFSAGVQEWKVK